MVRVQCLAQEYNTMAPARARTQTARSRAERTNHEATATPTHIHVHVRIIQQYLFHKAFTETGANQTMKTNQMAELKQSISTFLNPANQMSGSKQ